MRFIITQALISSITLLAIAPSVLAGGFASSCSNYGVSGGELYGTCRRDDGSTGSTEINLNGCLVNSNGQVGCRKGGDYAATCSDCSFSGTTYTCECTNDDHKPVRSSVNLNDCITNDNGNLTC
ncbi:Cyanovirin-N [Hygrophoropsis aurantiaca]|uniref:Cyanovirin-N n=1 Tax=Hygrophoropsis aurantiaca TaxID=72124 RepID=A0ACB8A810_9AGAM|nr:Cyanovirin-N [Hygrophoropsis aurantiaca]